MQYFEHVFIYNFVGLDESQHKSLVRDHSSVQSKFYYELGYLNSCHLVLISKYLLTKHIFNYLKVLYRVVFIGNWNRRTCLTCEKYLVIPLFFFSGTFFEENLP